MGPNSLPTWPRRPSKYQLPAGGGANPQAGAPGQRVPWLRGLLHAAAYPRLIADAAWPYGGADDTRLYGGADDARPRTNADAHPVTNAHRLEEERHRPCTTGLIGISSQQAAGADDVTADHRHPFA